MASITRSALKSVIKECLIEILAEGLNSTNKPLAESLNVTKLRDTHVAEQRARSVSVENNKRDVKKFNDNISNIARSLTNDSIMASLLEDTAKTTLQEQIENDRELMMKNPSMDGLITPQTDIALDNFDNDMAKKWEALAFSDVKKR